MFINFQEMRPENINILFPRNESPGRILINRQIFKDSKIQQLISTGKDLNLNQKHRIEVIPQSEQNKWQTSHSIAISYRNDPIDKAVKMEISIHRGLDKIINALNILPIGIGIYMPEKSLQIYGFDLPKNISKKFLKYVHTLLDPEHETFKNSPSLEYLMFFQKLFPEENSPGAILKDKEKVEKLCFTHKDKMVSNGPFIGGEILFENNEPMLNIFPNAQPKTEGIAQNISGDIRNFKDGLNYLIEDNKIPFEILLDESRAFLIFKHMFLCEDAHFMSSMKEEYNLSTSGLAKP